ncbi:MAG: branched-chain amino acid ABC transporter permease [Candidatus Tectomicrobia bacterium]|nr:branched-chain amino acid ABC transporter permease [Candidatus Tectomicrobia bacterium]
MFLQQLINGLMLGSTYSLLAIGYALVSGVLDLVHIAHGEVFMLGAFIGLQLVLFAKVNFFVAMLGAMTATLVLGIFIERAAFRPLQKGDFLSPLISTLGVALILQEFARNVFGAHPVGFPASFQIKSYQLGFLTVSTLHLIIIGLAFAMMAALHLFLTRTTFGLATRATAENALTARFMGINVNVVVVATFAIASAMAGAAGVLLGLAYNAITPVMGTQIGLKALAIIVLGGFGNITGAMAGGIILGLLEVMSVAYVSSTYRDAFSFGIIMLILIIRPTGLFGHRVHSEQ